MVLQPFCKFYYNKESISIYWDAFFIFVRFTNNKSLSIGKATLFKRIASYPSQTLTFVLIPKFSEYV